jgi:predicted AAA+ superfamily ATPase
MIHRELKSRLEEKMFKGNAIILMGARQVGKTTLCNEILKPRAEKVLKLNFDEPDIRQQLENPTMEDLKRIIADNKIIVMDEAQRATNIGLTLKRIQDNFKEIQLLVTGSSSLNLRTKINEPLTGRKWEYTLYPISTSELMHTEGLLPTQRSLENRLIYGSYPDVLNYTTEAKETLMNLADSYLYKDLLEIDHIRKSSMIEKLLVALALQVGSEISYNEIGQTVGSDSKTVEKYIDLLEKSYIIFRLSALSRNLRNELKKSKKIYFYDNGIRNAILQNFTPLALRNDTGALWENFFISERIKHNHYTGHYVNSYFWRTKTQQEIDYIEECDGTMTAFEMKWNPRKGGILFPKAFMEAYPVKESLIITPDNYLDYLQ